MISNSNKFIFGHKKAQKDFHLPATISRAPIGAAQVSFSPGFLVPFCG
jgi:hypothetical protein